MLDNTRQYMNFNITIDGASFNIEERTDISNNDLLSQDKFNSYFKVLSECCMQDAYALYLETRHEYNFSE